jgi:hypothetical protein
MHYVLGLCALIIAGLFYMTLEQAKEIGRADTRAALAEQSVVYLNETAALSQRHIDEVAEITATHNAQTKDLQNERDLLRDTAERRVHENPALYGDNFSGDIQLFMCLVEAAGSVEDRSTCYSAAAKSGKPKVAFTLSITPEWAERHREICEDFRDPEFSREDIIQLYGDDVTEEGSCNWSITGYTSQGGITWLNYLFGLADKFDEAQRQSQSFRDIIQELKSQNPE